MTADTGAPGGGAAPTPSDDGPRLNGGAGRSEVDDERPKLRRAEVLYEAAAAERRPVAPRTPVARPGQPLAEPPENPLAVLTDLVPVPPPSSPADGAAGGGSGRGSGRDVAPRRAARRPESTPFWRYGFPALMVVLVLLIPVLVIAGRRIVLQSTDGQLVTEVTDPSAAGWQAITDPTPTLLLIQTDANGAATGLTVMSLTGDGAGGLIFLPLDTAISLPDGSVTTLADVGEKKGVAALQAAVEGILGAGMSEVKVVTPSQIADLVSPVGPLTIENPDSVSVAGDKGQERVQFPKGTITLQPADVAAYLAATSPGESELNRLVRNERFWRAWLQKVGASDDPNVLPGETSSGIGRFVRTLAADRVEAVPLPVKTAGIPNSKDTFFVPIPEQIQSLVARLVPFPIGAPPGARPRVRLLDGTGTLDHGLRVAPLIVEGGGQIDQIGNNTSFGVQETTLTYFDDARRADVERLRSALGLGRIVKSNDARGAADVVIVLGQDVAAAPPKTLAPVTAAPATSAPPASTTPTTTTRSTKAKDVRAPHG